MSRLTAEIEPDDFDYPDDTSNASALSGKVQSNGNKHAPEMPSKEDDEGFKIIRSTPASLEQPRGVARESAAPLLSQESVRTRWTGFNGRANKVADTCYAFWVGGSLQVRFYPSAHRIPSTSFLPTHMIHVPPPLTALIQLTDPQRHPPHRPDPHPLLPARENPTHDRRRLR